MLLVAKNIISDSNLFFYLYNFSQSTTFEYNSKRFRNIFKPIFELLINKDNDNRETHKHLFAAYMNKNCFEAYLTTRWEKQDIPDKDVLYELVELSY